SMALPEPLDVLQDGLVLQGSIPVVLTGLEVCYVQLDQRPYIADIKAGMNGAAEIDVYSIAAPTQVPGIDFSDHRNYWEFGYDAVMISDTAFYRNKEYHKAGDTWDRLDYKKMGEVVKAVYSTAVNKR
ncbi:MAG: hypothetical protein NWR36_01510, partial [Opitutales bacterium]|nr:hypothetical protein [Opitutales bacterium]